MADRVIVENLISQSDVVISLLPVPFHPSVAELCIKQRKHLVTASYISPAMKDLHERFVTLFAIGQRYSRNATGR
jgi:alpha-aminoadipic semialdehyde synthase